MTTAFAPARVNLIGEHTDYSGGLVLPVAVDLGTTVHGERAEAIRLRSQSFGDEVELAADGSGDAAGWGRYVQAVAGLLAERGRPAVGFDGSLASTVPIGAGLSSSAALTVSVSLALCDAAGFSLAPLELAHLAREAELRAVGVPCGLMDPATSLLGRRGHALLLDCGTEEYSYVPLPPGIAVVVVDSGVRHTLEHSGYAARRAELERGLAALGGRRPADVTLVEAATADADDVALRRLRHVVTENERVRRFVDALRALDRPALGELLRGSHESLRVDFEVSTPELDLLVDLAYEHGAIGARMMGGGFGGSIVALADAGRAESVAAGVVEAYGRGTSAWVCDSVDGVGTNTRSL
jgi:galactokinase